MSPPLHLVAASAALVLLTFVVGLRMLFVRTQEMRDKRVHPQAASNSLQMAARLQNVQAADNFRNLFEVPVLFYALVGVALGTGQIPFWLIVGAWAFVALRVAHSVIHCTYNRVMHRFTVFGVGFLLVVAMWVGLVARMVGQGGG